MTNYFGISINLQKQNFQDSESKIKLLKPKGFKIPKKEIINQVNLKQQPKNQDNTMEIITEPIDQISDQNEESKMEEVIVQVQEKSADFSIIIAEIIKNKKLIIGHNLRIDLGLMYDHFIDSIPETYYEFTKQVKLTIFQLKSKTLFIF